MNSVRRLKTIKVDVETHRQLKLMAAAEQRTIASILRAVVMRRFREMEDTHSKLIRVLKK